MTYDELIAKVLGGKSVNARAKELGMAQTTLNQYVIGKRLPDCDAAITLAHAGGVSIEEAVLAIAAKKAELRPERVHSFLRPAMASVLTLVLSVFMLWSPPPNTYAAERTVQFTERFESDPLRQYLRGSFPKKKARASGLFLLGGGETFGPNHATAVFGRAMDGRDLHSTGKKDSPFLVY